MENRNVRITYYVFVGTGIALLCLLIWFLPRLDMRIIFPAALAFHIPLEIYQANIISRRNLPEGSHLAYRILTWHVLAAILLFVLAVFLLFTAQHFMAIMALGMMRFFTATIFRPVLTRKKISRYVVTSEKLIENNFWLNERNMSDLHSIVFNMDRSKIKIRFSDAYDIIIRRSEYSDAELAVFLRAVIGHSDGEAELDAAIQELLKTNVTFEATK